MENGAITYICRNVGRLKLRKPMVVKTQFEKKRDAKDDISLYLGNKAEHYPDDFTKYETANRSGGCYDRLFGVCFCMFL